MDFLQYGWAGPGLVLALLGLCSGFCSAWLGVGGSVFIVPLLPFFSMLNPLEAIRVSLCLIFALSLINSLSFIFQKLVLWPVLFRGLFVSLLFSFLSGFVVVYLSFFQIRFILWLFLLLLLVLPFLAQKMDSLFSDFWFFVFSSLMGMCSGLTGLGGGMILGPYFYESRKIPLSNIPAVVSCMMLPVSLFSLFGQISHGGFSFESFFIGGSFFSYLFRP